MKLISRTAAAVVTTLALAVPTTTLAASAQAAPGDSVIAGADAQDSERKKPKKKSKKGSLSLKRSAAYSHVGQPGVKITAVIKAKRAKGKVAFSVNGAKAKKVKIKKGKATFRLPSGNAPGSYKVTAKYKGSKKATKVNVYHSAIQLSATSFTISKSANSWNLPGLTGSVVFKGTPAKKGWVDIYQDGRNKAGSSSPYYCCMASVGANGAFQFASSTFLGKVKDKHQPGTYTYQAFYTDGPGFHDYIYSTPITVTVTP